MLGDGAPSTEGGQEHLVHPSWVETASHWVEIGSAILMAIALVGTSYSAWQSNRWGAWKPRRSPKLRPPGLNGRRYSLWAAKR